MYRHCIYCSGDLGRNEILEDFPVGRTVAFDPHKGRLWAVCSRCGRWNLAPLEERWETVEGAERLFRGARQRVHRENIGLARLEDGTRFIRVGVALPGEFAAWRYGPKLRRRLRNSTMLAFGGVATGLTALSGSPAAAIALPVLYGWVLTEEWLRRRHAREILLTAPSAPRPLRRRDLTGVTLGSEDDEFVVLVHRRHPDSVRLTGPAARAFLGRVLPRINPWGGSERAVQAALDLISSAGRPDDYLRERGRRGLSLSLPEAGSSNLDVGQLLRLTLSARQRSDSAEPAVVHPALASLAVEIALSEDGERRALDGELRVLAEQWREAEEIASIADSLPDDPLHRWLSNRRPPRPGQD